MNRLLISITLVLIINFSGYGQIRKDSLEYLSIRPHNNLLFTSFDKQINTYSLRSGLRYHTSSNKFSFSVNEQYLSTFIKSFDKNIKDEQLLSLNGIYNISNTFRAGIGAENLIFSDSRRIEINQASQSSVVIFSQYLPQDNIILAPFAGYSNNRQIGENDYGMLYGIEALVNDYRLSEFGITSLIKLKHEDISPRKNMLNYINLVVENQIENQITNTITAAYGLNRKDFYFKADDETSEKFEITNNIQSRSETAYVLQNRLQFQNFFSFMNLDLYGRVFYRSIDRDTKYRLTNVTSSSAFDTKVNELRLELESFSSFSTPFIDGFFRFLFSERDEKNLTKNFLGESNIFYEQRSRIESRKNNNSQRVSLSFAGNMRLSSNDRLAVSLFHNKLRYDTPSNENFDDRDELLSIARIRYTRNLSPFFDFFVNLEGNINQVTYIFAERSSNNNINRVIRLSSGGLYSGKNITSYNNFEVSANYTVYDFQDLNPNIRSFSFRQFYAIDSTSIKLTNKLSLQFFGTVRLSEQGDLKWNEFSTRPNRFLEEITAVPKLAISFEDIILYTGIRYFQLNTYRYIELKKEKDSEYKSLGPVAELLLYMSERLSLRINGWYEFITINKKEKREMLTMNLQVNWIF